MRYAIILKSMQRSFYPVLRHRERDNQQELIDFGLSRSIKKSGICFEGVWI